MKSFTAVGVLSVGALILPVATLPSAANDSVDIFAVPEANVVTDRDQVKPAQLEAAISAQSRGFESSPNDFSVIQVDDSIITMPNGSTLLGVNEDNGQTTLDWVPEQTVEGATTLSDASAMSIVSSTGMLNRNGNCTKIENNTGWMETCYERFRSSSTVTWASKKQYLNVLVVDATHKSKSVWKMYKARIRANPNQADISQVKRDPSADADHGNCGSGSLGVTVSGVTVTGNFKKCDKWDVGWSGTGQMDNTWFGSAVRSERNVGMIVAVARPSSGDATWALRSDFWAR